MPVSKNKKKKTLHETLPAPPVQNTPEKDIPKPQEPTTPQAPRKKGSKLTAMQKALKREDEKYKGIDFNEPPAVWSKEDQSKMREIMRTLSINYKKKANREKNQEIYQKYKHANSIKTVLIRDIQGLLQKDINLMNRMSLKHVAFSTFLNMSYDWDEVSNLLHNKHSPAECKEYWYMDLYPRIKNMGFSAENDKRLMELAIEYKFQNWDEIASNLIGHTEYQCYVHFRRNLYKKMQMPKASGQKE